MIRELLANPLIRALIVFIVLAYLFVGWAWLFVSTPDKKKNGTPTKP